MSENILIWRDLSPLERTQAQETYYIIRETEEERERNEITKEYPYPIDGTSVKYCKFTRDKNGYIIVVI